MLGWTFLSSVFVSLPIPLPEIASEAPAADDGEEKLSPSLSEEADEPELPDAIAPAAEATEETLEEEIADDGD